jgi:hypothetical protein
MEVLYEYFSIFFFVRAFLTFLCMDMGGQQFFSALEMRWMMVDRAGAFVRCIGEFLGGMIEEV